MDHQQAEQMISLLTEIRDLLKASGGAKAKKLTDDLWLEELAGEDTYKGIDVKREWGKMVAWCGANNVQPTRRRFVNWLNRVEKPVAVTYKLPPQNVPPAYLKEVKAMPKGEAPDEKTKLALSRLLGKDFSFCTKNE